MSPYNTHSLLSASRRVATVLRKESLKVKILRVKIAGEVSKYRLRVKDERKSMDLDVINHERKVYLEMKLDGAFVGKGRTIGEVVAGCLGEHLHHEREESRREQRIRIYDVPSSFYDSEDH